MLGTVVFHVNVIPEVPEYVIIIVERQRVAEWVQESTNRTCIIALLHVPECALFILYLWPAEPDIHSFIHLVAVDLQCGRGFEDV